MATRGALGTSVLDCVGWPWQPRFVRREWRNSGAENGRPGLARADRGRRNVAFDTLLADPEGFAEAACSLSVWERQGLANLLAREDGPDAGRAAAAWEEYEEDPIVRKMLEKRSPPRAYRVGHSLWLTHVSHGALQLHERGVTYHRRVPKGIRGGSEWADSALRDEIARHLWAHRGSWPKAVAHFASVLDE